jgi:hypothetical protein
MYPQTTTIPLTQGQFALVDTEDAPRLQCYKWQATKSGRTWYARRSRRLPNGKYRYVQMHRAIVNASDDVEVDHANGNGLDNRKENLRTCTHARNMAHQRKPLNNTSGYLGVARTGNRWIANVSGQYLGCFLTAEDAARARDTKARELHGDYAVLNFPNETLTIARQPEMKRLTPDIAQEIKRRYKFRVVTCAMLAKEYGVHEEIIRDVLKDRHWSTR